MIRGLFSCQYILRGSVVWVMSGHCPRSDEPALPEIKEEAQRLAVLRFWGQHIPHRAETF